jgi:molecular chaperone GrpE
LNDFLAAQGVAEVPAEGKTFDPNVHEAVSHEVSADVPDGTILRVHRRGFMLRDRLLRPATVVVAKNEEEEG